MKTRVEHNSQEKVYQIVIEIIHEIEDASLDLLIEIAHIELQSFTSKANSPEGASNPRYTQKYEDLINQQNGYINKLQGFRKKELEKEFLKNVQGYVDFVKKKHGQYTNGTKLIKTLKNMSTDNVNFLMLLNGIMNLYPCLYKMNETTRYPLSIFGYMNLQYLSHKNACYNLMTMVDTLKSKYSWKLQNA